MLQKLRTIFSSVVSRSETFKTIYQVGEAPPRRRVLAPLLFGLAGATLSRPASSQAENCISGARPRLQEGTGTGDLADLVAPGNPIGDALAERVTNTAYLKREKWRGPHIFDFIDAQYHDAIEAGTSTADVTQAFLDAATALADTALEGDARGEALRLVAGLYNLSQSVTFRGIGSRLVCDGIAATVLVARAALGADKALLELRQARPGYSSIGVGIEGGVRIDMGGFEGHGVRLWKPYDGVQVGPLKIDNIGDASHGLMIVPDPMITPDDPYSQTVKVTNVSCYHKNVTATASLFYIEALNEAIFELCKGFGTYYSKTDKGAALPSLNVFELVDCSGVSFINCSGAMANEHAFLVRTTAFKKLSRCVVIDSPTLELVRGVAKYIGVSANPLEEIKVLDPELRTPRIVHPYKRHPAGDIILSSVRGAVIDAKDFIVVGSDTGRCRVRSDGPLTNVTGFGPDDRIELLPTQFPRTRIECQLPVDQIIPSGSFTKINLSQIIFDITSEWDARTATMTVARAGRFRLELRVGCIPSAATAGIISGRMVLNGLEKVRLFTRPVNAALSNDGLGGTPELDLAVGDEVYFQAYADMGLTIASSPEKTYLRITPLNNGYAI